MSLLSDIEAIDAIAAIWISFGCDAEGFVWLQSKIAEEIRRREEEG